MLRSEDFTTIKYENKELKIEIQAKKQRLKDIEKFKILYEKGLLDSEHKNEDQHNQTKINIKRKEYDSDIEDKCDLDTQDYLVMINKLKEENEEFSVSVQLYQEENA